jgi:hypothetical protein
MFFNFLLFLFMPVGLESVALHGLSNDSAAIFLLVPGLREQTFIFLCTGGIYYVLCMALLIS